jgi:predicted RNA-binding Zn ribbon-like protein
MQVDSKELRATATRLRDDVADRVREAVRKAGRPEQEFSVEAAFDTMTTAAPYRAVVGAWEQELTLAVEAIRQLADALDRTADEYDGSDARSAHRTTAPR